MKYMRYLLHVEYDVRKSYDLVGSYQQTTLIADLDLLYRPMVFETGFWHLQYRSLRSHTVNDSVAQWIIYMITKFVW